MAGSDGAVLSRLRRVPLGLVAGLLLFAILAGGTAVQSLRAGFTPIYDEANYESMVKNWLSTGVYGYYSPRTGKPDATVTPGYPVFLAPFYAASGAAGQSSGGPYAAIFAVQVLLGMATVWGVWRLASGIAGRLAGAIAGIALALYPTFYRLPARLLTETLSACAFVLFLVVVGEALARLEMRWAIGAGALATIAVMTRPSFGPMVLAVLAWLLLSAPDRKAALRPVAAAVGVLALALMVWMGSNWASTGTPQLVSAQRGDPILAGVDPWYREAGGQFRYGPTYERYVAEKPAVDMTTYAIAAVKEGMAKEPLRYLAWFTIGKTDYIFFRSSAAFGRQVPIVATLWGVYHYLFVCLAFAGLALSVRVPGLRAGAFAFLAGWASILMLEPEPRYAFGLLPLMAVAAAVLIARAWSGRVDPAGRAAV
jgi:4-amino-4-deoxy-L-arabinose transferase-like glycosyltransferase